MGVAFLSKKVQGAVAQVIKNVCWFDALCRYRLSHKREDTEVAQQSEPGGPRGQAEGLSKRGTKILAPVGRGRQLNYSI